MTAHQDTTPYWQDTPMPRFARIERNERADVVVVGGGITGLTAAYLLGGAGKSVVLLERERCAQIDTGHTSAHLTMVLDKSLTDLAAHFGRDHAQAAWDAGLAAIAQIDATVRAEAMTCGFEWVPGYLHAPPGAGDAGREKFEEEAKLAAELGFDAAFVEQVPFVGGPGVRFDGQARFHPRKYLSSLARAAESRGVRIYEHSPVEEFTDAPKQVKANGCTISCDYVVLATHTPLMGNTSLASATLFQTKLALYPSYVVGAARRKA